MDLKQTLVKEFAKVVSSEEERSEGSQVRGTIEIKSDGKYVHIDGAPEDVLTPITEGIDEETGSSFIDGDRVLVLVKDHQVTFVKNLSVNSHAANAAQTASTQAIEDASAAHAAAERAEEKADDAAEAANSALSELGVVESVTDTLNWFVDHKKLTDDTTVVANKNYYIYNPTTGTLTKATPVGTENPHALGWFELNEAISEYVASHVALTNDGLYVVNVSGGWKVLISNGAGGFTAGIFVLSPSGEIMQASTANGISFSENKPFYIGGDDAAIVFDGNGHISITGTGVTIGSKTLSSVLDELGASLKSIEYGKGSSPTSHSDITNWSTTTPVWEEGKYIWMRATTNGLTYTYTCIQGAQGPQGDTGAQGPQGDTGPQGIPGETGEQGVSLTATTRYYKLSAAMPTDYPPSTGWQTSEPAYTPGDARNLYICDLFAWSNSTVTASEISLSSSYEAAKQAFDAAQGAMTAANGKNKVYHQTSQPPGGVYKTGDIWFDTDGGNKIYIYNETNGTWEASLIGNDAIVASGIDAGKITVGTIDANRIAANSLTIGKIETEDQEQILNSNVQVGGRNWLQKTGDLSQWNHNTTYVTDDDFNGSEVNLGHGSALSWDYRIDSSKADMVLPYADVKGKTFTVSFEAKSETISTGTTEYLLTNLVGSATAGGTSTKYRGVLHVYNNSTSATHLNTAYTKYSITITPDDAWFTSGSGDINYVYLVIYNYTLSNVSVRNIKMELGNKATDWTPAPEDVDNAISEAAEEITTGWDAQGDIVAGLQDNMQTAQSEITVINSSVNILTGRTTNIENKAGKELVSSGYAKITTTPSLELGRGASDWKVIITNQSIDLAKAGAVGATLSRNPERTDETLFRIDTTRLANLYFRSANGQGKLGIVAQSNGHISLKEI